MSTQGLNSRVNPPTTRPRISSIVEVLMEAKRRLPPPSSVAAAIQGQTPAHAALPSDAIAVRGYLGRADLDAAWELLQPVLHEQVKVTQASLKRRGGDIATAAATLAPE